MSSCWCGHQMLVARDKRKSRWARFDLKYNVFEYLNVSSAIQKLRQTDAGVLSPKIISLSPQFG